ncbi:MAG: hypothetical protein AB7J40_03400 [Candidatus Altimarinota bacterium]
MNVQTLRKAIASVSATALLLSTFIVPGMGVNVAQAATDSSHWAYKGFETLMDLGAVSSNAGTMLDDGISRGDFLKIILVMAGLADGSESMTELGQIAVDEGILTGDAGNTSALNLDRTLNRAEAVAIVNRTWPDLNEYPSTGDLSGVVAGEWYEMNARRAVAGAVIVGKLMNGIRNFAPGDTLTYGEAIAVAFQANRAVEALIAWQLAGNSGVPSTSAIAQYDAVAVYNFEVEIVFDEEGTGGQVVTGTLMVEKVADSDRTVLPDGSIATLQTVRFTNQTSASVTVYSVKIKIKGIANDNQLDGAFLMPFVSDQRSSFADNESDVFANITIPAGGTYTTDIALSIKASFQAGTLGIDVIDVDTNASNVAGLPLMGNLVQIVDGASSNGSLTVTALNEGNRTQRAGAEFRGGKFQFTAGSNEILSLKSILFDEVGSLNADDIAAVRLMNDQTGEELTVCSFTFTGDISCDFSQKAITLIEGSNTQLVLMVNVSEAADVAQKTFQAQIKRDFHVVVRGQTSGVNILPTITGAPIGADVITMEQGSLSLSKDSSSQTGTIQPGSTNARLASYRLEAFSETIRITDIKVDLSQGSSVEADFTGTIRVFMHDEGQDPLAGQSLVSIDAGDDTLYNQNNNTPAVFTSANNIRLAPGTKKILTVVVSLATTATNASTVTAMIDIRYERDVSGSVATTQPIAGNQLSIQNSTVQVSGNSAFTSSTEVGGTSAVRIGSITVKADNSEAVRVNTISINVSSITGLTNLRLVRADVEGAPQFGTTRGTVTLTGNTFSSSTPEVSEIGVGATATFDVYVDTQVNAASVFVTVPANGVTFTGKISSNTRTLPGTAANLPLVTMVAGEVGRFVTTTQPTKGVVHAGQTGVLLWRGQGEARFGSIVVEEFRFSVANGAGNFQNFVLKKSDGTVLLGGASLINGVVSFPVTVTMQKNLQMTLEVYADATPSGQMVSQQNVSIALSGVEYDGAGSGTAGVPVTSPAEVLTALASTSSELALQANQTLLVDDFSAAGADDRVRLATAFFDYDADYTASPTLNGAAASITGGTRISTFPYASDDTTKQLVVPTVSTASNNEDFTLGELVFVYQVGVAANTGFGVVTAAATDRVAGTTLNVWLEGGTASTAIVLAAGDVVLHIATPVAYTAAPTPATLAIAVTAGQVAFYGDSTTGANTGLTVITDSVALGANGSAAGAVINGITLGVGDTLAVFSSQQSEIPSTSSTFSYTAGTVLIVADSAAPANSGVHLVNNTLLPGQSLLTAGALITGKTLLGTATGDRVAVLNGFPIAGEPKQVQDSYPELSTINTGFGTLITGSEQLVAKLKILNKGPRELLVTAFKFRCTGSWTTAGGANVHLNDIRIERNGTTTISHTRSDAGALDCRTTTPPVATLDSPESVAPNGGTLELWIYQSTASAGTGTNLFFQLEFDQTAGSVGSCVVRYFYNQASGGTGTNPTSVAPAQVCNGNKLFGPSFES